MGTMLVRLFEVFVDDGLFWAEAVNLTGLTLAHLVRYAVNSLHVVL